MTYLHDSNEEIQSYINHLLLLDAAPEPSTVAEVPTLDHEVTPTSLTNQPALNATAANQGEHSQPLVSKPRVASATFIKHLESLQQRKKAIIAKQEDIPFDNRPLWGQADFTCVSFNVSGLKLAVAKAFILDMQPLDVIETQPDQVSKYFLGAIALDQDNSDSTMAKVIDTAQMVMPERYKVEMRENYRYLLRLKDCDWCLAVDSVGGDFNLSPQKVRWRSEHTRREWLAGTIIDKMCALIDVDALNRQFMATLVLEDE